MRESPRPWRRNSRISWRLNLRLLAHHCTEAGLIEKAVGYWLKAGQQSIARSAMTEAVAQLRKGLELLRGVPDGEERQGAGIAICRSRSDKR